LSLYRYFVTLHAVSTKRKTYSMEASQAGQQQLSSDSNAELRNVNSEVHCIQRKQLCEY
jgi:hypothetical protein